MDLLINGPTVFTERILCLKRNPVTPPIVFETVFARKKTKTGMVYGLGTVELPADDFTAINIHHPIKTGFRGDIDALVGRLFPLFMRHVYRVSLGMPVSRANSGTPTL
jgi:hypothetical protein